MLIGIARRYQAYPVSATKGSVHSLDKPSQFVVSLFPDARSSPVLGTCYVKQLQMNARPCPHAIWLMKQFQCVDRLDYMSPLCTLAAWRAAFLKFYQPILINSFEEHEIMRRRLKTKRGRRQKKRADHMSGSQGQRSEIAEEISSEDGSRVRMAKWR